MKLSPECAAKISSYIGFAFRAGKVVRGTDNILASNKRMLVIISSDLKKNASKKLEAHAEKNGWHTVTVDDMQAILPLTGVKAIGIREKNLAEAILKQVNTN